MLANKMSQPASHFPRYTSPYLLSPPASIPPPRSQLQHKLTVICVISSFSPAIPSFFLLFWTALRKHGVCTGKAETGSAANHSSRRCWQYHSRQFTTRVTGSIPLRSVVHSWEGESLAVSTARLCSRRRDLCCFPTRAQSVVQRWSWRCLYNQRNSRA